MASSVNIPGVRGFRDVLPDESHRWRQLEAVAAEVFGSYGFAPVSLPVLERAELFSRSLGATSDVVEKEMFGFEDRDGTMLALRPEATASTVRAYLEHGPGAQGGRARYWYVGPMFRRERPQRGRFRQFQQIGVEAFGDDGPLVDAEVLIMLNDYLGTVGASGSRLLLGSVGDAECRPSYRDRLQAFGREREASLCDNCRRRLDRNPLRLLDCKEAGCQAALADAPLLLEHLCTACAEHFSSVRRHLDAQGVRYEIAPRLVRGLDYYTRTAFEVVASGLGAQNAVGGGGRYDALVATLGGPTVPALGFALGVDRLVMALGDVPGASLPTAAILPLVEDATEPALALATRWRRAGTTVMLEPPGRSLKALLRGADRQGARLAVLLGADELAVGRATVRDLARRQDHPQALPLDIDAAGLEAWLEAHGGRSVE